MERRYLIATLALAVTFSLVSHGLRSGNLARLPHSRAELAAEVACARNYVAQQLMAKLAPYADHNPAEEAQMLAELSMPNLDQVQQQASDAETLVAGQIARQKCEAAQVARQARQQVYEMRVFSGTPVFQVPDVSIVRAEELSDRAQELTDRANEWSDRANQRSLAIQMRTIERAQHLSARAMERAQRAIEQSQRRMSRSAQPGMPIHINLVTPVQFEFTVPAPVAPEPPSTTLN